MGKIKPGVQTLGKVTSGGRPACLEMSGNPCELGRRNTHAISSLNAQKGNKCHMRSSEVRMKTCEDDCCSIAQICGKGKKLEEQVASC